MQSVSRDKGPKRTPGARLWQRGARSYRGVVMAKLLSSRLATDEPACSVSDKSSTLARSSSIHSRGQRHSICVAVPLSEEGRLMSRQARIKIPKFPDEIAFPH